LNGAYDRFVVRTRFCSPNLVCLVCQQAASHIRHDIAISNVAAAQSRANRAVSALIADADRGMSAFEFSAGNFMHALSAVLLDSLKPTLSARFDSASAPSGCLEHTREDVLGKLHEWINQPSTRLSIFWLAGMAGTGKTTIAKTLCDQLAQSGKLSASFFASRQATDRRDAANIVRTFAYDLAFALPSVRSLILDFLRSAPAVTDNSLHHLIQKLLAGPLATGRSSTASNSFVVFVIDALDECDKVGNMPSGTLIPLIATALREQPIKLLITSRLEASIQSMFASLASDSFRLHNVEDHVVTKDVQRYFETGFAEIVRNHNLNGDGWPPINVIPELTKRTCHLFIYATTVLRYVGNDDYYPPARLAELLCQSSTAMDNPYAVVDMVYLQVFMNATRTSGRDSDYLCRRLRKVVGTMIMVQEPLLLDVLAFLCELSPGELAVVLGRLSSVILVELGMPVQIFHQSFPDYATNPQRCEDERFLVVPEQHQSDLAIRCLDTLCKRLRQDICDIRDPSLFNAEVEDLEERLERYVSPELRYASVHWMFHVASSGTGSDALFEGLSCFCAKHIFHWIEVLSLTNRILDADRGLRNVLLWCTVSYSPGSLSTLRYLCPLQLHSDSFPPNSPSPAVLLNDTLRVLRDFRIPLEAAPLQVYHSVLIFMPACVLQEHMSGSMQSIARMVNDRDTVSTSEITLEEPLLHVESAAFSLSGKTLVTCSPYDRTLRVWDVISGHVISQCAVRHDMSSNCVLSSLDGVAGIRSFASGSPFVYHFGGYDCSSIFSSDGRHLAECAWSTKHSNVMYIGICHIATGSARTVFSTSLGPEMIRQGHSRLVQPEWNLVFSSPEELRVAIYSGAGPLLVWAISTIETVEPRLLSVRDFGLASLISHDPHRRSTLAFSSQGKYLIVQTDGNVFKLFVDNQEVSLVSQISHQRLFIFHKPVVSLDGRYVAVDEKGGILIWDTHTDQNAVVSFRGALCFSPDGGTLAVKGLNEHVITCLSLGSLDFTSSRVESHIKIRSILARSHKFLHVELENGSQRLVDTISGAISPVPFSWSGSVPQLSDDGNRFLYCTSEDTWEIYDLRNETRTILVESNNRDYGYLSWEASFHGEHVFADCEDAKMRVWETRTGQVEAIMDVMVTGSLWYLTFTANDSRLLFTRSLDQEADENVPHRTSVTVTQLWDIKASTLIFNQEVNLHEFSMSCSPDGHCFAIRQHSTIVLRDTADGHTIAICDQGHSTNYSRILWSPDSSHFLHVTSVAGSKRFPSSSSSSCLWERKGGSQVATMNLPWDVRFDSQMELKFSADGRRIVWTDQNKAGCWIEGKHFPVLRDTDQIEQTIVHSDHCADVDIILLSSGWIQYSCAARAEPTRFLWVPPHRRPRFMPPSTGTPMTFCGWDGVVTILDISSLLESLRQLEATSEGSQW
jgi:WD40 repeat protein